MKHAVSVEDAAEMVPDGATVLIGGFMAVGTPHRLIAALIARNVKDLTIVANDTATPDKGIGLLIHARAVRKAIVSHIGLNPETQAQMMAGELEVDLVPQGTLVERIRAGGVGLGGILTPTGVGTQAAEGKEVIRIDGRDFLLEKPIRGDVALIAAHQADYAGNLDYALTAHNFNPVMAMAADKVIAEPQNIVPVGVIPPDGVKTPGVLVDHILERAH